MIGQWDFTAKINLNRWIFRKQLIAHFVLLSLNIKYSNVQDKNIKNIFLWYAKKVLKYDKGIFLDFT